MHATGLCATGGCRIQASTRDRLVHKSGLCTRHYGIIFFLLAVADIEILSSKSRLVSAEGSFEEEASSQRNTPTDVRLICPD